MKTQAPEKIFANHISDKISDYYLNKIYKECKIPTVRSIQPSWTWTKDMKAYRKIRYVNGNKAQSSVLDTISHYWECKAKLQWGAYSLTNLMCNGCERK